MPEQNARRQVPYQYMKFEINASSLVPENENQAIISGNVQTGNKNRLSQIIDEINLQMGKGKVCFANNLSAWKPNTPELYITRQEYESPAYFTDWNQSPLLS